MRSDGHQPTVTIDKALVLPVRARGAIELKPVLFEDLDES
jgi:hypothetical protein